MKRTRLRHRSKTNSHPERDEELRASYRESNPRCELSPVLGLGKMVDASDIHHIFGGKGRWDLRSNLIALSREAHDFCHRHPIDGRILAMHAKLLKLELDDGEIKQASGMHIAGWLAKSEPTLAVSDGPYCKLCEMLMGKD